MPTPRLNEEHSRARKDNLDFSELAGLGIDLNRPAMLLDNDVVADREAKPISYDSLVEATGRSLLHLESVDGQLFVRVRTRFDGWRRNVARGCTSTGVGGGIYLRGRYSFGRSLRG